MNEWMNWMNYHIMWTYQINIWLIIRDNVFCDFSTNRFDNFIRYIIIPTAVFLFQRRKSSYNILLVNMSGINFIWHIINERWICFAMFSSVFIKWSLTTFAISLWYVIHLSLIIYSIGLVFFNFLNFRWLDFMFTSSFLYRNWNDYGNSSFLHLLLSYVKYFYMLYSLCVTFCRVGNYSVGLLDFFIYFIFILIELSIADVTHLFSLYFFLLNLTHFWWYTNFSGLWLF